MMDGFSNMMNGYGMGGFIGAVTWIALMFFLVLGSIYFLKEINKK
ncbi:MAG: hypothetical protein WCV81_02915 [Microgenomates group bacterium]|jgi:hypothetical protein